MRIFRVFPFKTTKLIDSFCVTNVHFHAMFSDIDERYEHGSFPQNLPSLVNELFRSACFRAEFYQHVITASCRVR